MGGSTPLVAIIGGGLSGIATALRLQEQFGPDANFVIFEKKETFGGVWRDSKWPTAGVDVMIHLYSLYSERKPNWENAWAGRDEVFDYISSVVETHNLAGKFRYNYKFEGSDWQEETQEHKLQFSSTSTGDILEPVHAKFIVSAVGPLSHPRYPSITGLENFQKPKFHSSEWDDTINFEGKRIGVIGNGSSGIQIVPGLAAIPGTKIKQFIRSPGYFIPKLNFKYSEWTKWAFQYVPGCLSLYRFYLFVWHDTRIFARRMYPFGTYLRNKSEKRLVGYLKKTAPARYHNALVPNYPLGCKRTAYNAGWLECLHKDNVELFNDKITEIDETGLSILKDGKPVHHEFDILIFATGFKVVEEGVGYNRNVRGEDGIELCEYWESLGGPEAYLGVAIPKFPNYFIVIGPNSTSTGGWGFSVGNQSAFIARIIKGAVDRNIGGLYPRPEVHQGWNVYAQKYLSNTVTASSACDNWHRTASGKVIALFPGPATELWWRTRRVNWSDWTIIKSRRGDEKPLKTPSLSSAVTSLGLIVTLGWAIFAGGKQYLE